MDAAMDETRLRFADSGRVGDLEACRFFDDFAVAILRSHGRLWVVELDEVKLSTYRRSDATICLLRFIT